MNEVDTYIGLGSNLDDPEAQIGTALQQLADLERGCLLNASSLYCSPPMGPGNQPDYINAVALLRTTLVAEELLDTLLAIELQHARVRGQHWGPRTLDLDLLLYGQIVINSTRLTVPHPGIAERNFVLYPLAEIAPLLVIPGLGSVQTLLAQCPDTGLTKLTQQETR
jgi:2-amino-4-hydroxy-6-hydroxymethyldihydropteridine diphosphokinase